MDRRMSESSGRDIASFDELTVFQAAPLVWKSKNEGDEEELHPIELLDFDKERKVLTKSLQEVERVNGTKVSITFNAATTERLTTFLATSEARVLHFTCHGHPSYVVLEDGLGGAHFLAPDELRELFLAGNRELRFVYVAACHSTTTGEAFVQAGVPHVLCCPNDKALRNISAITFAAAFYPALACGRTLKESYELGRQAVRLSPAVTDADNEMNKFLLLPEDADHDVHIFFTRKKVPQSKKVACPADRLLSHSSLPYPPDEFIGREQDLYRVLQKIRSTKLVKLKGGKGCGKRSLAAAATQYVLAREHSFAIERVIWLPLWQTLQQDTLSSSLFALCGILQDQSLSAGLKRNSHYINLRSAIFGTLGRADVMFVIETKPFFHNSEGLSIFLEDVFQRLQNATVVLVCQESFDVSLEQYCPEAELVVGPISNTDSAILFGKICTYVPSPRCFAELVAPDDAEESAKSRAIWNAIGQGIPSEIQRVAKEMTAFGFNQLLEFAAKSEEEASASPLALGSSSTCRPASPDQAPSLQWTDDESSSSEHDIDEIVGVEFSGWNMDDNTSWNENVLKSKRHIETQMKKLLKYGSSVDGAPQIEVEHISSNGKERAVVRLDCEIDLREDLRRKDFRRVKEICGKVAELLKRAGATEIELEHLMIGCAWQGSLELLLESPLGVFGRLFSARFATPGAELSIIPPGVVIAPAFSLKLCPSMRRCEKRSIGGMTINGEESDVLLWKGQDVMLLIPTTAATLNALVSGGIQYWREDVDDGWRELASVSRIKNDAPLVGSSNHRTRERPGEADDARSGNSTWPFRVQSDRSGLDGDALSSEERAENRRKSGKCVKCGRVQTHELSKRGFLTRFTVSGPDLYKGLHLPCYGGLVGAKETLGERITAEDREYDRWRRSAVASGAVAANKKSLAPAVEYDAATTTTADETQCISVSSSLISPAPHNNAAAAHIAVGQHVPGGWGPAPAAAGGVVGRPAAPSPVVIDSVRKKQEKTGLCPTCGVKLATLVRADGVSSGTCLKCSGINDGYTTTHTGEAAASGGGVKVGEADDDLSGNATWPFRDQPDSLFGLDGNRISSEERAENRRKSGKCVKCGLVQTHELSKRGFLTRYILKPVTRRPDIYNGVHLSCYGGLVGAKVMLGERVTAEDREYDRRRRSEVASGAVAADKKSLLPPTVEYAATTTTADETQSISGVSLSLSAPAPHDNAAAAHIAVGQHGPGGREDAPATAGEAVGRPAAPSSVVSDSVRKKREKKGLCPTCGVKLFSISALTRKKTPVKQADGVVLGTCLKCSDIDDAYTAPHRGEAAAFGEGASPCVTAPWLS